MNAAISLSKYQNECSDSFYHHHYHQLFVLCPIFVERLFAMHMLFGSFTHNGVLSLARATRSGVVANISRQMHMYLVHHLNMIFLGIYGFYCSYPKPLPLFESQQCRSREREKLTLLSIHRGEAIRLPECKPSQMICNTQNSLKFARATRFVLRPYNYSGGSFATQR